MDANALLASSDLFSTLDPDDLARLAGLAKPQRCSRNQVIFREGDEASELYVVRSGRIAIAMQSPDGRESLVALMEAGDLFGEMALFDEEPRSAQARALEPSELLSVPFAPIRAMFRERPELLWEVVALLARRLRTTDAALADSVFLDVTGRTAKRLLELAGDADEFTLPITQEELAGLVGASRVRVNQALAFYKRRGTVSVDSHLHITVHDPAALALRCR